MSIAVLIVFLTILITLQFVPNWYHISTKSKEVVPKTKPVKTKWIIDPECVNNLTKKINKCEKNYLPCVIADNGLKYALHGIGITGITVYPMEGNNFKTEKWGGAYLESTIIGYNVEYLRNNFSATFQFKEVTTDNEPVYSVSKDEYDKFQEWLKNYKTAQEEIEQLFSIDPVTQHIGKHE